MKFFNFNWLKSTEREELIALRKENEELKQQVRTTELVAQFPTRPFKKIIVSGDIATVVMNDGTTLSKAGATPAFIKEITEQIDASVIISMFLMKQEPTKAGEAQVETKEERQLVTDNLDILRQNDDFEIRGEQVFLKGVNLPMPASIISSFIEIEEKREFSTDKLEDEYLVKSYRSLKMFWLKLATSPREESREQVLLFCKHNDIRLTRTGNIIGYRRVVALKGQKRPEITELNSFVKGMYKNIKARKKGPANFDVYKTATGVYFMARTLDVAAGMKVGNLKELFNNPLNEEQTEQIYTSWHNSGKYTFKIGDVYKAKDGDIDTDAGQCAAGGLHFAACTYNYSSFGDTPVVVLINPAKTITIPLNELQKGRTTEMKVAMINPNAHGVHIDEALLEQADNEYNEFTINELEEALQNKSFKSLSVEEETPDITMSDLKTIKDMLRSRIVTA